MKRPERVYLAFAVMLLIIPGIFAPGSQRVRDAMAAEVAPPPPLVRPVKTLVLYDTTGSWAHVGELYAIAAANLSSRFGTWVAKPVVDYAPGELLDYSATIYIGSTHDEPIPPAFLDDVLSGKRRVLWIFANIWQLTKRVPDFATRYGWNYAEYDFGQIGAVRYKGTDLTRYTSNSAGIMDYFYDTAKVEVIAEAVRPDGSKFPWALTSGNLTYMGEIPFAFMTEHDRYLILADMLFDILADGASKRHRALVRLEDVGPDADPAVLRKIADYLADKKVPFSIAVYPKYIDPLGKSNNGVPVTMTLQTRPAVVEALQYMQSKGGTVIMHGYTHQYSSNINPYDGISGNDFEFFLGHVDDQNYVIYDGPVPEDSSRWASARIQYAEREFRRAGLSVPAIFEFPHYAASAVAYEAIAPWFKARYERGLYFNGILRGGKVEYSRYFGQFFPYLVRDVYGSLVIPENLGNYQPKPINNHPVRLPKDIIENARKNLIVRDGFASFFYHPYLGADNLPEIVEGIQALGYQFVAPMSVIE